MNSESPQPDPSTVSPGEAGKYGATHWRSSYDFWHARMISEISEFEQLPFSWAQSLLDNKALRRFLRRLYLSVNSEPVKVKEPPVQIHRSPVVKDTEAVYYYNLAFNSERYAGIMRRLTAKLKATYALRLFFWVRKKLIAEPTQRRAEMLLRTFSEPHTVHKAFGNDLISIVTPTYNRGYLISRAINSVLAQSYTNWELLVVDDGSTDDTHELISRYDDDRIRYVKIPRGGVSRARNTALDMARGRYITFLDSDNVLDPGFLRLMHNAISRAAPETGFVYCECSLFEDGKFIKTFSRGCTVKDLIKKPIIDLGTMMCRREVTNEFRFNERMDRMVDYELILRIISKWGFSHITSSLMYYFRLGDGITFALPSSQNMTINNEEIRRAKLGLLKIGVVLWDNLPEDGFSGVSRMLKPYLDNGVNIKIMTGDSPEGLSFDKLSEGRVQFDGVNGLSRISTEYGVRHLYYPVGTADKARDVWKAAKSAGITCSFAIGPKGGGIREDEYKGYLPRLARSSVCSAIMVEGEDNKGLLSRKGYPEKKLVDTYNESLAGEIVMDSWLDTI
jgi:glycosyltransferase involved in cell wall biosynthesis